MNVVVVGAGLAGLTAAHRLSSSGLEVRVLEVRSRLGGRIWTLKPDSPPGACFDLGATWHWADQRRVPDLARRLGVATFPQYDEGIALHEDPDGPVPVDPDATVPAAFRFAGGAQSLCDRLADTLPDGSISFGATVTAIDGSGSARQVAVATAGGDGMASTLSAAAVVVAVPPRLALQNIEFAPPLPDPLVDVMEATPTWMADAVKCVAVYETPFWRANGRSGTVFSHVGPLHEVHDGCDEHASVAALWGLLGHDIAYRSIEPAERVELVLTQLVRLFGPEAADPVQYFERDWSGDPNTNEAETDLTLEPAEYGHEVFTQPLLDGRLVWAGAETARDGGGYMEGAVTSGERAADLVLKLVGGSSLGSGDASTSD